MRKQQIGLLLAVITLLILVLVYAGITKMNKKQEKETETQNELSVFSVDVSTITEFSYDYNGQILHFEKKEDTWICKEDTSAVLDTSKVENLLSAVSSVVAQESFEPTESLEEYGLSNPSQTISITGDKKTITYLIGDSNDFNSQYYMKLDSSQTVYMVSADFATNFKKDISSMLTDTNQK